MTIRLAAPADAEAVATLETDCLGPDAWSAGLVREGVTGAVPYLSYRVALSGPTIVGYAATSVVDDVAELQRIAVDPGHRRAGWGARLLDDAIVLATAAGAERLLLEVRETNAPALALYADHGLVELARRSRYYHDGATAVVLERVL